MAVMALRTVILIASSATLSAASSPTPSQTIAELQGRVPGKPQRCMPAQPGVLFSPADSDPHLLLFDDGKTIWANRLPADCGYEDGQTAVPDAPGSFYCKGDLVTAGGRITLFPGHRCPLGDFTPWRTPKN